MKLTGMSASGGGTGFPGGVGWAMSQLLTVCLLGTLKLSTVLNTALACFQLRQTLHRV